MLDLTKPQRLALWEQIVTHVEEYADTIARRPVARASDPSDLRRALGALDFSRGLPPGEAVRFVVENLERHQVHTTHPRYYGLFNPNPTPMGIAADFLTAAFNPQLAAWGHSPFANECERHVLKHFAAKFGYPMDEAEGSFTSGGAEANHSGLLLALTRAFPSWGDRGARGIPGQPVLYVSDESHHSFAPPPVPPSLPPESGTD